MYYRDHFISAILFLILASVLRAAIAYRYCTIKTHSMKSQCWQYKFHKSLRHEFVKSLWHVLQLHARLHSCIHDASGQCDAA